MAREGVVAWLTRAPKDAHALMPGTSGRTLQLDECKDLEMER